jgi:hypothetical protein
MRVRVNVKYKICTSVGAGTECTFLPKNFARSVILKLVSESERSYFAFEGVFDNFI